MVFTPPDHVKSICAVTVITNNPQLRRWATLNHNHLSHMGGGCTVSSCTYKGNMGGKNESLAFVFEPQESWTQNVCTWVSSLLWVSNFGAVASLHILWHPPTPLTSFGRHVSYRDSPYSRVASSLLLLYMTAICHEMLRTRLLGARHRCNYPLTINEKGEAFFCLFLLL